MSVSRAKRRGDAARRALPGTSAEIARHPNWHGWRCPDLQTDRADTLHIGSLPGRQSVCLYVTKGAVVTPLAYFCSDQAAVEAMMMIDRLLLIEEEDAK